MQMKRKCIWCALALTAILVSPEMGIFAQEMNGKQGTEVRGMTEESMPPNETAVPGTEQTAVPQQSEVPVPTNSLSQSPAPASQAPKKTAKPKVRQLKKVRGVKLVRYSTSAVKVTWKRTKTAKYYRVYYAVRSDGKYRQAGTTQDNHYMVKKLKNHKTYYFYVTAGMKKKKAVSDSLPSQKQHIKMKAYHRKVIFAGDSITQGIGYKYFEWHMNGIKKTVAYRGLNTVTFHTNRVFNGRTGLQKVIAEHPYRVYMMMGVNEIHYRRCSLMLTEYKGMVSAIQQECPNTDIVLCAVAPVTRAERSRCPGYRQIPVFNSRLKKLAKQMGVHYLDYTAFLKDSGGYLKQEYAERDGYHWKAQVYGKFARIIEKYEKELDGNVK